MGNNKEKMTDKKQHGWQRKGKMKQISVENKTINRVIMESQLESEPILVMEAWIMETLSFPNCLNS